MADCVNCLPCGTNGNGIIRPLPGDPSNDGILTATPAFGGIDINIKYPSTNPFAIAHTILWRGTSSNFALARRHVDPMAGSFFYDKVDQGIEYFYWIQFVSVHGTIGELIGPASATARPLIADLIEQLTQQIDEGMLAQALRAKLDEISLLNDNLMNEIMARQNANISLAQAVQDAQNGVAQALTFIINEINDRTSEDQAIIEHITGIAGTIGDDYAAIIQAMQIELDQNTGRTNALWTAQVTVNGLIGGFGINNNGQIVEAGFDVDRFWIGRTGVDNKKPFIIENNEVFINRAAINYLTISQLRNENGSVQIAPDGKIRGQYLEVNEVRGGAFTGYAWPPANQSGFYLGPDGLLLGNANGIGGVPRYFQVTRNGDIHTPRMTLINGVLNIGNGKFVANPDGSVIADNVDIRRRTVVQTGIIDPTEVIQFIVYYPGDWGDNPPPVQDILTVNKPREGQLALDILTDIYDANTHNVTANQPYYVVITSEGALRNWSGPGSGVTIELRFAGQIFPIRTYDHASIHPNTSRLAIKVSYQIILRSGGFTSFRLPLLRWTAYRL